MAPAPSHSLQRPTPKFEDIQRVEDEDFDSSDTSREKFDALARGAIAGNYVIDLGAGRNPQAYRFAWYFGATEYVGIEANEEYAVNLRSWISDESGGQGPEAHVFVGDIVDALKRLPDNCGNVVIFLAGIDFIIDFTSENHDYIVDLQNQIDRVGAKVIKYASISLGSSFKRTGGVRLPEGDFAIFEKR